MWGLGEADDFDRSLFKPPEPTDRVEGFRRLGFKGLALHRILGL